LGDVFGSPLDRAFWEANNPLTSARTANLVGLRIYFDCGTEDEYGFDAGAKVLADLLKSRGIAHEFHLYPGGHGWSYLAEHLHATFEFHSRAFGLAKRSDK
jgi:S-formylglutathione hydrolase FrmB